MRDWVAWEKLHFGAKNKVRYRKHLSMGVLASIALVLGTTDHVTVALLASHGISGLTTLMWIWE